MNNEKGGTKRLKTEKVKSEEWEFTVFHFPLSILHIISRLFLVIH